MFLGDCSLFVDPGQWISFFTKNSWEQTTSICIWIHQWKEHQAWNFIDISCYTKVTEAAVRGHAWPIFIRAASGRPFDVSRALLHMSTSSEALFASWPESSGGTFSPPPYYFAQYTTSEERAVFNKVEIIDVKALTADAWSETTLGQVGNNFRITRLVSFSVGTTLHKESTIDNMMNQSYKTASLYTVPIRACSSVLEIFCLDETCIQIESAILPATLSVPFLRAKRWSLQPRWSAKSLHCA